jgi:NADPH2:quinone reductase
VGKDTLMGSLDCLRPRGLLALFGQSSGKPDPLDITLLTPKGSLYVTRPSLAHYIATRQDLVDTANDLFDVVAKGIVKVSVNQTYALADTAQAHRDLEGRKTTGSTVLLP